MHKKFVWKFAIILYLLMTKTFPFSFAEANGEHAEIDSQTVKRFSELVRYKIDRIGGVNWPISFDAVSKCLAKALVRPLDSRISFLALFQEFTSIFNYYQPSDASKQLHHGIMSSTLAPMKPKPTSPFDQSVPETRQVVRGS